MAQAIIAVIFASVGLGAVPPVTDVEGSPGPGQQAANAESPPNVADKSPGAPSTRQGSEATTTVASEALRPNETPQTVAALILQKFGVNGRKAVQVFRCESHLKTTARNGQHLGIGQLGKAERARYGHGEDAETQINAAYELFLARGWNPWRACA